MPINERGSKYEAAIRAAKRNYFLECLAPYIADEILDTRRLKATNPRLYEGFRLGYRSVTRGCDELGLYRSRTAKDRAEGTTPRKGAYRHVDHGNA